MYLIWRWNRLEYSELTWKNISLHPYEDSFFDFIYNCYQDYDSRFLFTNDFVIISRNEFWDYINRKISYDFHDFMIIQNNLTNLPIGFIYTYNYDKQNDFIYFSIYLDEKSRNSLTFAVAGMIFFNYIFKYYPIRKIYCSLFDYNTINKKIFKNAGFKFEGKLSEYRYYNRKYHDMNIFALFRQDFYILKDKLRS